LGLNQVLRLFLAKAINQLLAGHPPCSPATRAIEGEMRIPGTGALDPAGRQPNGSRCLVELLAVASATAQQQSNAIVRSGHDQASTFRSANAAKTVVAQAVAQENRVILPGRRSIDLALHHFTHSRTAAIVEPLWQETEINRVG